jgi:hypothetical protein
MLQLCSSASSRMQTCIVMKEHYPGCHHSTPFVLNGPAQFFLCVLQYIYDIVVVPCCMNSTISTPFVPQKTVIIYLAGVCLNHFGFFSECV